MDYVEKEDLIWEDPNLTNKAQGEFIKRQFGDVPHHALYRAKSYALYGLNEDYAIEFNILMTYVYQVGKTNLRS